MVILILGQPQALGSGNCRVQSLGGDRREPGAGAAVTLVAPSTLHQDTEDLPQSDCQQE